MGTDAFWRACWQANPTLTADVVDSSQAMLRILDRRIRRCGPQARQRICLHHADALQWKPSGSYDLIVSHFFLDCFFPQQLEQLFAGRSSPCSPGAQWVISEFAIPRNAFAAYLRAGSSVRLYRAFGLLTGLPVRALPDYATSLLRRGLAPSHDRRYLAGLLCSQIWTKRQRMARENDLKCRMPSPQLRLLPLSWLLLAAVRMGHRCRR